MWDWGAIFSFIWAWLPILGLVGFISGIFTLRDRFRNWRAAKSSKKLKVRLIQMNTQAIAVKLHRSKPSIFLIQLLEDAYYPIGAFIGIVYVVLAILLSMSNIIRTPNEALFDYVLIKIYGFLGLFFLMVILNFSLKIRRKIMYFYHPDILANDAQKLLDKAKPLGLVIDFDIKHINNLIKETNSEKLDKFLALDNPT